MERESLYKKGRIEYIDIVKGIGILLVIWFHFPILNGLIYGFLYKLIYKIFDLQEVNRKK